MLTLMLMMFDYFCRSFELFESWSDEQIEELSNFSVTEYYGYKKVVVGDARRNDFIYLCIKVCILHH